MSAIEYEPHCDAHCYARHYKACVECGEVRHICCDIPEGRRIGSLCYVCCRVTRPHATVDYSRVHPSRFKEVQVEEGL